jgi:hypothetical protein
MRDLGSVLGTLLGTVLGATIPSRDPALPEPKPIDTCFNPSLLQSVLISDPPYFKPSMLQAMQHLDAGRWASACFFRLCGRC